MSEKTCDFELELRVRDYECDLQGVVNNAVYQNYLEHARHEYLRTLGLDFARLHEQGHDLVLTRCELDYRAPLRSGDAFRVALCLRRHSRLRFAFLQDIYRAPGGEHVLHGLFIGTCLDHRGRPAFPPELLEVMERHAPS